MKVIFLKCIWEIITTLLNFVCVGGCCPCLQCYEANSLRQTDQIGDMQADLLTELFLVLHFAAKRERARLKKLKSDIDNRTERKI